MITDLSLLLIILLGFISTTLGSALVFFSKKELSEKNEAIFLGFASGVMIAASIWSLLIPALEESKELGKLSFIPPAVGFLLGALFLVAIDHLVPHMHLSGEEEGPECKLSRNSRLFLAMSIHNFPEGLATFISGLQETSVALPIAAAIAIHNIPEGIAVSVPVYFATGSRKKAFVYSFLSGLSEPVGALVGYTILRPFMNDIIFGVVFAMVAGIMVFISLDELLPSAREYGEHHLSIYGLVSGMIVMAVSLLLFL